MSRVTPWGRLGGAACFEGLHVGVSQKRSLCTQARSMPLYSNSSHAVCRAEVLPAPVGARAHKAPLGDRHPEAMQLFMRQRHLRTDGARVEFTKVCCHVCVTVRCDRAGGPGVADLNG